MKKYGLILLLVVLTFASCSQVFEAGVSGKVVDDTGVSIRDVYVYAYTDKQTYQSDLDKFEKGTITQPSEGYIPRTLTNDNGEFTINKIVWETKNGKFGKTADVVNLYLIFYKEDYKPCGCGPISVISGSTNSYSVRQTIEK